MLFARLSIKRAPKEIARAWCLMYHMLKAVFGLYIVSLLFKSFNLLSVESHVELSFPLLPTTTSMHCMNFGSVYTSKDGGVEIIVFALTFNVIYFAVNRNLKHFGNFI